MARPGGSPRPRRRRRPRPVQAPGPRDVRHGRDDRAAAGRARRAARPGHRLDGRRDPRPPQPARTPWCSRPRHGRGPGPCGDPAPDAQGAQGRRARPVAPLPRPAAHVRHPDGGPRRADADVAGVDGARQHRDHAAVCRLRASARRAAACAGRVHATRDDATVVARLPVRRSADGPQAGWLARRSMFS